MQNLLTRIAIALLTTIVLAGCGQKGPLFLPGDPNSVRITTPPQNAEQAEDDRDDDDEDDETPITIQN